MGVKNMEYNKHCSSCSSCTSCQKQQHQEPYPSSLSRKIVGTVFGLIFIFHILALRKLAYLKMKKEYIKMLNDPKKREKFIAQILAGINLKKAGICNCEDE